MTTTKKARLTFTFNESQRQRQRQHAKAAVKDFAATWRALSPEMKFFCFSVCMLLLSQLWLSYRHSQVVMEVMQGDRFQVLGEHRGGKTTRTSTTTTKPILQDSTLSRSLSAFYQLSEDYMLHHFTHNKTFSDSSSSSSNQSKINNQNNSNSNNTAFTSEKQLLLQQMILKRFTALPTWLEEYAQWHSRKMAQLNAHNWKHERFLLARCLASDRQRCGDASHRLMSIPATLFMAHQTNRILLIQWTQPAALENYLVPPAIRDDDDDDDNNSHNYHNDSRHYSIDWRVPEWLQNEFREDSLLDQQQNLVIVTGTHTHALQRVRDPSAVVVIMRHLTRDHGSRYYNQFVQPGEPPYRLAFGRIWNIMFRPSKQLQSLIEANMDALGLSPGQYVTAQIRTLDKETPLAVKSLVQSSLQCTRALEPSSQQRQILVTSESQAVLDAAMDMQGWNRKDILALKTSPNILSLDKDTEEWRNRTTEDYYAAFVYLYMFANSKCVAYFDDNDGRWGSLISQNPLCAALMKLRPGTADACRKLDLSSVAPDLVEPPSPTHDGLISSHEKNKNSNVIGAVIVNENEETSWEPIPEFPDWMNDYFEWHRGVRKKLNKDNWQSYRYLVLRCLTTDEKCGGASDRLQSFLLGILFASLGERLLLIHWERPSRLEDFLLPPQGGLDWRVPDWLDEKFNYGRARMIVTTAFKPVTKNSLLVTMRHQQFWPEFYDERKQENERSYEDIFHDVWLRVFQPSLPVQSLIKETMRELQIETGKYVAVHVRAKYINDRTGDHSLIHNAINCASQLRPGWPIYFASDSAKVVQSAIAYGKSVGGTVVAREDENEPLHLDRGAEFLNHKKRFTGYSDLPSSRYYNVFVDLYLLANSQCVSLGYGGYGRLGSMLSFNRTCSTSYLSTKCQWTGA